MARGLTLRPVLFRDRLPEVYQYFVGKYGHDRQVICDDEDKRVYRELVARALANSRDPIAV